MCLCTRKCYRTSAPIATGANTCCSKGNHYLCYASITYGDDSFVAPLCEILLNSQDPNTRYMAIVALERIGNRNAIDTLLVALNDPGEDYEGRRISVRAIAALKTIQKQG
ncbi:MAG: HEAT repeat domain-containing protein [Caldilinea sp. CFX5]|nr:HEAT repeat domain-containing protein [Caldilinea sp. CFX5]